MGKYLQGMSTVMSNLNKEILKIEARSMKGLIEAAIIIRRDMDKTSPTIPVDTGNLRGSWFTEAIKVKGMSGLLIGFSANYAVFVHERVEGSEWGKGTVGKVDWNREGSGPKFLEAALTRNEKLILQTIRDNAFIR
jgi:hypothetical protein